MENITMPIPISNWVTPDYVFGASPPKPRQEGLSIPPKWELKEVDPLVLSKLCDAFREEVFKKSGHTDPRSPS